MRCCTGEHLEERGGYKLHNVPLYAVQQGLWKQIDQILLNVKGSILVGGVMLIGSMVSH